LYIQTHRYAALIGASASRNLRRVRGAVDVPDELIAFGPFRLSSGGRLLRDGKDVRLGSRGLDLLVALLDRPGAVVTKEELVQRVWPNTFVDEVNLRYQMATLRKVLGEGGAGARYIRTISGRGYCFVGAVDKTTVTITATQPETVVPGSHNLPGILTRTIGRDDVATQIAELLRRRRFVTIAGPGGIGKTTVALMVSWNLVGSYADGVRFVDLGPVTDPRRVANSLASALEITIKPDEPLPGVLAHLRDKSMLIALDNCEHVADEVAAIVEAILKRAPNAYVIATSREPLRAQGEYVYRLTALAAPPQFDEIDVARAFAYSAIELFVERATAALDSFRLTAENLAKVCELCRRLDGIPLAIELAAARINLGLDSLSTKLADRTVYLLKGRRTALPHQQTLYATLDWSHELLSEAERVVLRRLGLFRTGFTDPMATAIVADATIPASVVPSLMAELVDKSLIALDVSGKSVVYRLFETTRVYASEKLAASGDAEPVALRHAQYYKDLMRRAESDWMGVQTEREWLSVYRGAIDDVRTAIDWALASPAGLTLAIDLVILSGRLWFRLCLIREYRERIERALERLGELAEPNPDAELRLQIALGHALWYSAHDPDALERIFMRARTIADALGDTTSQLQSLWGLWAVERARGQYKAALVAAKRYKSHAKSIDDLRLTSLGDRILGLTHHYLGNQDLARQYLEPVRDGARRSRRPYNPDFQLPPEIATSVVLCRVQWLQGYPDQAIRTAQQVIEYAQESGHWSSLVYVLTVAGFEVSIWTGDLSGARRRLEMLVDHVEVGREAGTVAQCFELILRLRQGSEKDVLVASAIEPRLDIASMTDLASLSSLPSIPLPLPEIKSGDPGWSLAELLRVDAEIALSLGGRNALGIAEQKLSQALEVARKQSALSWELRSATSLARLWRSLGRNSAAHDLLGSTLERFTEGFGTADLVRAQRLLEDKPRHSQ
jgi:predicted ATPase/DNA-binding winged helix-turn-helix (wHTH) protein